MLQIILVVESYCPAAMKRSIDHLYRNHENWRHKMNENPKQKHIDSEEKKIFSKMAIISLVLAIVSLLSVGFSRLFALILSLIVIILGVLSFINIKKNVYLKGKSASVIAIFIGIFVFVPILFMLIWLVSR